MTAAFLGPYRDAIGSRYDELVGADGGPRPGWETLALDSWDAEAFRAARSQAHRLLEDDGVTYNPLPATWTGGGPGGRGHTEWRLDPLPTVLTHDEWTGLERGASQRARLLEAVLADLYGPRRLLTSRLVPPELLWQLEAYLRPAWGLPAGRPRLVLAATDVGRAADGSWRVISDRAQAPSGLGYAMENRRVVARLLPDAYQSAELHRLTAYFGVVRDALTELAAPGIEGPRVVVLTPGRHSETAFDQAYIASLLGFPLVTGADLEMADGRIWTRELDGRRPVDVVLRRVDDVWCDPLELRPDSELGVPGFLEACRRGSVVSANGFGAGLVESPAFAPLLPALCEALLDESLLLPSADAWWGGTPQGLDHLVTHLDRLVIRPVNPGAERGIYGPGLSRADRETWRARLEAHPERFVGQEVLPLSTTPTVAGFGLGARPLTLRLFGVAHRSSYTMLPGALGRIVPDSFDAATGRRERVPLSKDVWVLKAPEDGGGFAGPAEHIVAVPTGVPMVPHALENLYWMGRYTERAEGTTRHLLALRRLATELPVWYADPGRAAVDVLAAALTHATTTYPGLLGQPSLSDATIDAELRDLLVDETRAGSVAQALAGLAGATGAVRDQLSSDVFTVLGGLERALTQLAEAPRVRGPHILDAGGQVLSSTLALAGITVENMVHDVGWHLLDIGRGIERATQLTTLVKWTMGAAQPLWIERHLVTSVLSAAESVLTHRRRFAGTQGVDTMLDLLLLDEGNPRSVAYQLSRVRRDLARLPGGPRVEQLTARLDDLGSLLASHTGPQLATPTPAEGDVEHFHLARREALVEMCESMERGLAGLSDAMAATWFWHPVAPRPLGPGVRQRAAEVAS
ncbi:circularly permuted type 2 ATP-grasp protein [Nocardioides sp.]|uniref:circularly permuted type 2 ATP-grasp protein n=1 Tax=Nocardioides sp. TaxID=35761 RepID=UPI003527E493